MYAVDVVGTGFTVLDRVYADSLVVSSEELGGSCGNVLISLAMLQRNVAPVLSLGEDEIGVRLVVAFRRAGAETRYIRQTKHMQSPILAQHLHSSGIHTFEFRCPETAVDLPRYQPIEQQDVSRALPAIKNCNVFYTDRLSSAIVDAMEAAADAGSIVYFEPSAIGDERLFSRAVASASILKFSSDRLASLAGKIALHDALFLIITHGESGLEVRRGRDKAWCRSYPAPAVRDTCGSGDMVSVGLIDWILNRGEKATGRLSIDDFVAGVEAGQRLAAENCAYIGARGIFRERGAEYARSVLRG
ncbi:PfkB family carbohydrate kinase [Mesorhizobium sp. NPDC059025]|uniref:PfkB family carbohydrate kinase n=1 Tax=unclassified Mesorhizobium TaxID=325217 RepID=UPI00368B09E1